MFFFFLLKNVDFPHFLFPDGLIYLLIRLTCRREKYYLIAPSPLGIQGFRHLTYYYCTGYSQILLTRRLEAVSGFSNS